MNFEIEISEIDIRVITTEYISRVH